MKFVTAAFPLGLNCGGSGGCDARHRASCAHRCGVGIFSKLRKSRSETKSGQKSGVFASG
jgi:hypothetical protein